jgi:hypothetical protein
VARGAPARRARGRRGAPRLLEVAEIDEDGRGEQQQPLVAVERVDEHDAETIGVGEHLAQESAPLLLDARDLAPVTLERERPGAEEGRGDLHRYSAVRVENVEALVEDREALLQRAERAPRLERDLEPLQDPTEGLNGAHHRRARRVEERDLEAPEVTQKLARQDGQAAFPLFRRKK